MRAVLSFIELLHGTEARQACRVGARRLFQHLACSRARDAIGVKVDLDLSKGNSFRNASRLSFLSKIDLGK